MSVSAVQTGRLKGRNSQLSAPDVQTVFRTVTRIQGPQCSREAYVFEEAKSFAVTVEIIREVLTVCGPNDFGKSRE